MTPLRSAAFAILLSALVSAQGSEPLTLQAVEDTIEAVGPVVRREYFDPEVGRQVEAALREGLSEGRFPNLDTRQDVADAITRELYTLTRDKHLVLLVVPNAPRGASPANPRADDARRSNGGVQRVEILPGNVGYLNLTFFWRPGEGGEAIAAAMHVLRNADALIIDMRTNGGGSPEMAAMVIGYLFDEAGLPLFDIIHRTGPPDRYATPSPAPTDRNANRPVYVLVSTRTFSAGEGLAFLLQERKRAEVVGEVTAGAANPGQPYPVNEMFQVVVPNGQVKSAVGGGNWEGSGVMPDVVVAAADALQVAHLRALRTLIDSTPDGAWQDRLRRDLALIEANR